MPEQTIHDVMRLKLRDAMKDAGGVRALARKTGLSPTYVSRCASGKERVAGRLAEFLGFQRISGYEAAAAPSGVVPFSAFREAVREFNDVRALAIRLAWNLVADESECTCEPGDECPLCHAKRALGDDFPREYRR